MNIKLVYKSSSYNIDVMNESICQYLYKVTEKVFHLDQNDIILYYGDKKIKNDSKLIFDVLGAEDKEDLSVEETIIIKKKGETKEKQTLLDLENSKLPLINPSLLDIPPLKPLKKNPKKQPIRCQICNHKESIFYCRECNLFICFECNVRYTEHHTHKTINLEDGDTKLGLKTYKEKILAELNLIDLGYKKYTKWVISNADRESFLATTFKLLENVKKNSQRLSDISTFYNLDQNMIDNLKEEIDKTEIPLRKEEFLDAFFNLNSKDKEIENYIKCVDLQIIKTEYNKVLINFISIVQKNLQKIIDEVHLKLGECEDMKFWGINEIKLYLKNAHKSPQSTNPNKNKDTINSFDNFEEAKKGKKNIYNDSSDKSTSTNKEDNNFIKKPSEKLLLENKKSNKKLYKKNEKSKIKTVNDDNSDNESELNNLNNKNKKNIAYNSVNTSSNKKMKIRLQSESRNDNLEKQKITQTNSLQALNIGKSIKNVKSQKILLKDYELNFKNSNKNLIKYQDNNDDKKSKMKMESTFRSRSKADGGKNEDKNGKSNYNNTESYPLINSNVKQKDDKKDSRVNLKLSNKYRSSNFMNVKPNGQYSKKLYGNLSKIKNDAE